VFGEADLNTFVFLCADWDAYIGSIRTWGRVKNSE
jgi:hypothetical protein